MDDCFHGKLDRKTAEERLTAFNKRGAYLFRESDKKFGSFVLSFKGQTCINHFKITRWYGSYFIGGRNFDSLIELIDFYHSSDLLTNERLVHPVPPPEPIQIKCRLFVSVLPYTALGQDELSFKKNTLFIFEYEHDKEWYWCRIVETGEIGLVFANFLEEIHEDIDPNEVFPWFHSNLSRTDAVDELAKKGPGSFLVKLSENTIGDYTLFYHAGNNTIQRFKIVKTKDNRYIMGNRCFDSLGQIIELYQAEEIYEGHCLKYPVVTSLSKSKQISEQITLSTSLRALEIREKPEDIYNTVKQSRELAQSREIRGWLSLKKNDLTKKWKKYYFILNPITNHLYYYEKPQQAKPKGLIDLSYSYIYAVHITLFDWPQCFQIVEKSLPCFATVFYLRCDENFEDYRCWLKALRQFTANNNSSNNSNRNVIRLTSSDFTNKTSNDNSTICGDNILGDTMPASAQGSNNFVETRTILLEFIEALLSKSSTQTQIFISYNQDVLVAKTKFLTIPSTFFSSNEASYKFVNIPNEVRALTISLHQINKKSKQTLLSEFSIKLDNLESGKQIDTWFEFISLKGDETFARLRLTLLYNKEMIMHKDQYQPLEDLIVCSSNDVLNIFERFGNIQLAEAVAFLLNQKRIVATVLKPCCENEVAMNVDSENLFEKHTFSNMVLEMFMRMSCLKVLAECLREPIKRLFNIGTLDSGNQNACENLQNLFTVLDDLIQNVYDSVHKYPHVVRYLFAVIQKSSQAKWPKASQIRTRVVSRYLFSKIICPTILRPRQYGLINFTQVTSPEQKKLALVAVKCLQNLANFVEPSQSMSEQVSAPPRQPSSLLQSSIELTINNHSHQQSDSLKTTEQEVYDKTDSVMQFILSPQIEEWMEVLEPVVLKKKLGMIKFVDELCDVEICDSKIIDKTFDGEQSTSQPLTCTDALEYNEIEPIAKHLSVIHSCCEANLCSINASSSDQVAKKLVTILMILTQRKSYYESLNFSQSAQKVASNVSPNTTIAIQSNHP